MNDTLLKAFTQLHSYCQHSLVQGTLQWFAMKIFNRLVNNTSQEFGKLSNNSYLGAGVDHVDGQAK